MEIERRCDTSSERVPLSRLSVRKIRTLEGWEEMERGVCCISLRPPSVAPAGGLISCRAHIASASRAYVHDYNFIRNYTMAISAMDVRRSLCAATGPDPDYR